MDRQELAARLEELAGKATPGPWDVEMETREDEDGPYEEHLSDSIVGPNYEQTTISGTYTVRDVVCAVGYTAHNSHRSNQSLICELRNHLPTILSALRGEGWVSVEERLPEFGVPVIGVCLDSSGRYGGMFERFDEGDGWLWSIARYVHLGKDGNWQSDAECDDDYKVTHWFALPTPPQQEADTGKGDV